MTAPIVFKDPATLPAGTALSFQDLMNDLTYLNTALVALQAGAPATPIIGLTPSADGKGIVVTLNGATLYTVPMPRFSYNAGAYTVGAAYQPGASILGPDGSSYYAQVAFTATVFATDKTNGNMVLDVQGVSLPLASTNVRDATQNKTLDQVIAAFNTAITANAAASAANAAAITKIQANVAAINAKLGTDSVAGFPLTLQS